MDSSDLYGLFRSQMVDTARPYLWSDDELWAYMNDAYRMFVRLMGGIADYDSIATSVDIVAGEQAAELHPSLLRVRQAFLASTGRELTVINPEDVPNMRQSDYGQMRPLYLDLRAGPVQYMLIGAKRNVCKWVQIPVENDEARLVIHRLPLTDITGDNQEFEDIGDEHVIHLLKWMRHLAYQKQDADTFDRDGSERYRDEFTAYCLQAKAEWERYKHKTRVVAFGGL